MRTKEDSRVYSDKSMAILSSSFDKYCVYSYAATILW